MTKRLRILRLAVFALAILSVAERGSLAYAGEGEGGGSGGHTGGGAGGGAGAGGAGRSSDDGSGDGDGTGSTGTAGGQDSLLPLRGALKSEQALARNALARGLIQPFSAVMRTIENAQPGSLLKVRLKRDDLGVWIYSLVVLSADGRYHTLAVDAQTTRILQTK